MFRTPIIDHMIEYTRKHNICIDSYSGSINNTVYYLSADYYWPLAEPSDCTQEATAVDDFYDPVVGPGLSVLQLVTDTSCCKV